MQIDNNKKSMLYIALIFLSLSFLSIWVKKTPWIWAALCAISLVFALKSGKLTSQAFIPLLIGTALFWTLQFNVKGLSRFVIVGTVLILAGAIFSCLVPGYPSCFKLFLSQINYGKILITLPILGWLIPTLANKADWSHFFKSYFALSTLGALLLLIVACSLVSPFSTPSLFLKTPSSMLVWIPTYLFASIIPEEVLLRGFLQKEIFPWMGKGLIAHALTAIISSSIFSFFHLGWITDLYLLGLIFFAGCVYGALYQITKMIEASIVCRTITSCLYFFILSKEGFL